MNDIITFLLDEWMLSLAFLVVLALIIRNLLSTTVSGIKSVNAQEAVKLVNRENGVFVDVRLDKEFSGGHILNARHIPLGLLEDQVDSLQSFRQTPVVVVCRSGNRSANGGRLLRKHGFEQVYNLSGGMMAWEKANLPVQTG